MAQLRVEKVISALPGTLQSDTIYFVRVGSGFSLYVTDSTGAVAHTLNTSSDTPESNPTFTYASGNLTRIDYTSGNYKVFTYSSGNLTQLDYVVGIFTYRKTFTYADGALTSITETVI